MNNWKKTTLGSLPVIRNVKTKRISSWDTSGGNADYLEIQPGRRVMIADIQGAGCINHFWCTIGSLQDAYLRRITLRMKWDGEEHWSVEVPAGDFFGVGHGMNVELNSMPLQRGPQNGKGFSCFFSMPFSSRAEIEITNECDEKILFFFYADYEQHESVPSNLGRFHACWNRENPTAGISDEGLGTHEWLTGGYNLSGDGNYQILNAEGAGVYVGCNLNIRNLRKIREPWPKHIPWPPDYKDFKKFFHELRDVADWLGEGDDMIFIDGERWPPSMHGTGLEDYFNCAWCPTQTFQSLFHGITVAPDKPHWNDRISLYRFHIEDPVYFSKSIKVSIEHGHNNSRNDDYSSTAYWYQHEPHLPFREYPSVTKRLP